MLGIPLRYLLKNPVELSGLVAHPIQTWTMVWETYLAVREGRKPQCPYESDSDWERRTHLRLGLPWPCQFTSEFQVLWTQVIREMEEKGVRAGPLSFGNWNDGDAGFVRAIWCLIRHLKPRNIVETGVAHGVTSRFILEALERNGAGHLSSIDLPPLERDLRQQVGIAVGDRHKDRWSYIKGSSRLHLPKLLSRLGQIDLFIHDSLHSERNVRFELDQAWASLRPGGALVVDDVDANWGFRSFLQDFSGLQSTICEAEPLHPDLRRFNHKGLFGIILKEATATTMVA
jgi:hypothetical protein